MPDQYIIYCLRAFGLLTLAGAFWFLWGAAWVRHGTLPQRLWANLRTVAVFITSLVIAWIYLTFNYTS